MPIENPNDAAEVESRIGRIFAATPPDRAAEVRALFVEVLDFDPASGYVDLGAAPDNVVLPASAERIATMDSVNVVYVPLSIPETDRVRKGEAAAAAKLIANQLDGDLFLVFTNTSNSQLHLVYPSFQGSRPILRRMVVARDLPRRTAVQQVSNIYWNHRHSGSIVLALDQAFDVEPVTKQFFSEYKRVFEKTEGIVVGFGKDDDTKRRFVQTLFNRLMFVYFLSRKGWLSFNGEKDYLNALWQDYRSNAQQTNFYRERLKLLFFFGLNNPQSHDLNFKDSLMASMYGDVPFLNGGLFEKTDLDKRDDIDVPDEAIKPILSDLFDRFNFTVMESTPFDVEVAVDPEMLGKVFEELVTGRHASGAYYTPRPVVSFMCREALKGYLEGQDTGVSPEAIARFVDERDTSGISVSSAKDVARALDEVTVVDPACGSGAYLLGMMQELVELQTALFNVGVDAKGLYDLKLHIIERNLYGVDIDDFAANIAMLRLWLSLAIEYEGDQPEPLPNLDFKVVCGDSLLGPDPSVGVMAQSTLGRYDQAIQKLDTLKAKYMRARTQAQKQSLRDTIRETEELIKTAMGDARVPEEAVDWRLQFAEVFGQYGGFDVSIANPPYVRQEEIKPESYKKKLVAEYAQAVVARSDLYCYFYARALQLLSKGGMHVFVCSNSWLDVGYGAKLQEYLLNTAHVQAMYESAIERQFSTADINTVISVIRKAASGSDDDTRFVSLRAEFNTALENDSNRREFVVGRDHLLASGRRGKKYVGDKWGGKYLRAPSIYHYILKNFVHMLMPLADIATVKFGLKTGANGFFYLNQEKIRKWGIEERFLKPVMTTPLESRSIFVDVSDLPNRLFMCHEDKRSLAGTGAIEYILYGESQGFHRRRSVASRIRWYDLGNRLPIQLAMNKLVGTTARSFWGSTALLFSDNFQEIRDPDVPVGKLCTSLNSSLFQLMINLQGRTNFGSGVLEVQTYETENVSVVNPAALPQLEESLFATTDWDVLQPSQERRLIDDAVFDALGLTQGERDAVYEGVTELVENRIQKAGSV